MQTPSLAATVARMKTEILAWRDRTSTHSGAPGMLSDAQTFGDLHDYCDANCIGGFCDDEYADALIAHFGGRDEDEGMPAGMLAFINAAQDACNTWIASGEMKREAEALRAGSDAPVCPHCAAEFGITAALCVAGNHLVHCEDCGEAFRVRTSGRLVFRCEPV